MRNSIFVVLKNCPENSHNSVFTTVEPFAKDGNTEKKAKVSSSEEKYKIILETVSGKTLPFLESLRRI